MSRFTDEISGNLGPWWQEHARAEVKRLVKQADEGTVMDVDGAIRWRSNGNYLPEDICEKLQYAHYPFSINATREKRQLQTNSFLKEYRSRSHLFSLEELEEMRAAFGKGTVVIDVLSGKSLAL